MASQVKDRAWLEWIAGLMGLESRQTQSATLPACQFHCLLDELPLHLIPQKPVEFSNVALGLSNQPLFFNPWCSLLSGGEVPEELESHRDLLQSFWLRGAVAWVKDSSTNSLDPFWLSPRLEAIVSSLHKGDIVPASLPKDLIYLLTTAGILTREGDAERRISEWNEIVRKSAKQFREKGYVAIGNLIHPFNLAALRRYFRNAVRQRAISFGDEQCPLRYGVHNEKVARFFHHQITKPLAAIVGEAIKPSYVYSASYLSGAELKKHTDREQCEFSVTLCLDFSPEPKGATSWPIRLDTAEGTATVYQALGDGLLYRGPRLPHYRNVLDKGHMSTSIFFHYVAADFSGPLD
jgi:hypothetical protein